MKKRLKWNKLLAVSSIVLIPSITMSCFGLGKIGMPPVLIPPKKNTGGTSSGGSGSQTKPESPESAEIQQLKKTLNLVEYQSNGERFLKPNNRYFFQNFDYTDSPNLSYKRMKENWGNDNYRFRVFSSYSASHEKSSDDIENWLNSNSDFKWNATNPNNRFEFDTISTQSYLWNIIRNLYYDIDNDNRENLDEIEEAIEFLLGKIQILGFDNSELRLLYGGNSDILFSPNISFIFRSFLIDSMDGSKRKEKDKLENYIKSMITKYNSESAKFFLLPFSLGSNSNLNSKYGAVNFYDYRDSNDTDYVERVSNSDMTVWGTWYPLLFDMFHTPLNLFKQREKEIVFYGVLLNWLDSLIKINKQKRDGEELRYENIDSSLKTRFEKLSKKLIEITADFIDFNNHLLHEYEAYNDSKNTISKVFATQKESDVMNTWLFAYNLLYEGLLPVFKLTNQNVDELNMETQLFLTNKTMKANLVYSYMLKAIEIAAKNNVNSKTNPKWYSEVAKDSNNHFVLYLGEIENLRSDSESVRNGYVMKYNRHIKNKFSPNLDFTGTNS